ncbi:ABC transporter ATP-binding protein/permease [Mycolicibacterium palauense]|uniref:ABC transporter ATP-binding protein/permease n=1 Tax=Mycolicibacterium palauense TaxID=2034511 RepID=UPI000BFED6FC|nr:ABC transporter ATP-binding protein/permease [Mycolicibacterium palauense]
MDRQVLTPSIDWGHELGHSTLWVLATFGVTAPLLIAALLAVGRLTVWGRQFREVTGGYFTGRDSLPVWAMLAALLLSTIVAVRISVLLSYYANDLFSALQIAFQGSGSADPGLKEQGIHGFWMAMVVFAVLAALSIVRFLADLYLAQRFMMRWRVWLSRRLIGDWLDGYAYFRGQLATHPIDNPDQRIQQDIDVVTAGVGGQQNVPAYSSGSTLLFGAVESLLTVVFFGAILWQLSGPLVVGSVTVPRALFWIVIVYVLAATVVAFWIGHPLIRLSFVNELRNAGFRYALTRVKDSAGAVGFYRGENVERDLLDRRLSSLIGNYRHWLNRMVMFLGWNASVSQAINPLPYLVQAQRLFAQEISFGDVMQSATAFHAIHDSLSFFRNAYDSFAGYRAAVLRLHGLIDANRRARAMPRLDPVDRPDGAVRLSGIDVRRPDGRSLVRSLDLSLDHGDTVMIKGPSGSGKTVLLESLAGLWPYASGRVGYPRRDREVMFVSQTPYVPLGDLRAVVSYPLPEGCVADADIQRTLVKVALPHLMLRLGEVKDWARELSPGEQQRIAFARVLLNRPKVVFLDESTSALDGGTELMLYRLLRAELPDTIVVSVSHRSTVEQFHDRRLELLGDGGWRLAEPTAPR